METRPAVTIRAATHRFPVSALLVLLLGPAAQAQSVPGTAIRARLQAHLDSLHDRGTFPGATVGVVLPGGASLGLAVGMSDTVARRPMRPDDRMLQGSVGKTYFAAVAMQLVGEGKLKLDDPIARWLGEERWFERLPNGRAVTVRMLMNHTSGIVRYEMKPEFARDLTAAPDKVWTAEERIAYVLGETPPFEAGKGWTYSDTNYILLGMILERVTGRALYDEVRSRVLEPLGLRNTVPSDSRVIPGLVQGYAGANNPFGGSDPVLVDGRFVVNPQFEWAGGGFASGAEDLARWAKLLYEGKAYDPKLLEIVLTGVEARGLGQGAQYGLGVIIRPTPLGISWGHSGFFPGYLTEMRYYPDHGFSIALQVNTSAGRPFPKAPSGVLQDLAQIVAEELRK